MDGKEAKVYAVTGVNVPKNTEENENNISIEEVFQALKETKKRRSPILDECRLEYLKKGGVSVIENLGRMLDIYLQERRVPENWHNECIVPLYKGRF